MLEAFFPDFAPAPAAAAAIPPCLDEIRVDRAVNRAWLRGDFRAAPRARLDFFKVTIEVLKDRELEAEADANALEAASGSRSDIVKDRAGGRGVDRRWRWWLPTKGRHITITLADQLPVASVVRAATLRGF